jgi:hypothetical protein
VLTIGIIGQERVTTAHRAKLAYIEVGRQAWSATG